SWPGGNSSEPGPAEVASVPGAGGDPVVPGVGDHPRRPGAGGDRALPGGGDHPRRPGADGDPAGPEGGDHPRRPGADGDPAGPGSDGEGGKRLDPPRVIAVVVTYNRRELLLEALAAVQAQSRAPDAVIVVDNASTDDSAAAVRARFPMVR